MRIDFRALFDMLPTPYLLLDRNFDILAMNQAYLATTMRTADDLIGRNMFSAFPAEGESLRMLRDSLEEARDTGATSLIPLLPYAIRRPKSEGGGFEQRYWSSTHVPIRDERGEIAFILQNTQDVTELQRLKDAASAPVLSAEQTILQHDMLRRAEKVQALNRDLVVEYSRLHRLMMQAPGMMLLLSGPDHVIEFANRSFLEIVGHRNVTGLPARDAVPEIASQGYLDILDQVFATGQAYVANTVRVLLNRQPGGFATEGFFDAVFQPVTDPAGQVHGIFIEAIEVTHRVRAAERQSLLMDELNHRVKNTLATVQAIASQTLRNGPPEQFAEAFQARLTALARTHDVLTQTRWEGAELRALLEQELHPYRSARLVLRGPDLSLTPRMALSLGLVFHELATNAAKYGALSAEGGTLGVTWAISAGEDGSPRLSCEWHERGGPPVVPPTRFGFGSRLIESSIRIELEGAIELDYGRSGLIVRFAIPLPSVR